jgi:ankyrin repeat protein
MKTMAWPSLRRRSLLALGGGACVPTWAQDDPWFAAADQGDLAALQRLAAAGQPIDARNRQGHTALLVATHRNHIAMAQWLVAQGANVNAQDAIFDSPYLLAGARGRLEILRLTLRAGADLRSVNRFGGTALIPAAHYGHVEVVRELLKTDIDVNHVNRLGWTALLEAILLGDGGPAHTEIVRLLLAHGARPNLPDRDGVTPLAHARRRGQGPIVKLLTAAGAR